MSTPFVVCVAPFRDTTRTRLTKISTASRRGLTRRKRNCDIASSSMGHSPPICFPSFVVESPSMLKLFVNFYHVTEIKVVLCLFGISMYLYTCCLFVTTNIKCFPYSYYWEITYKTSFFVQIYTSLRF